MCVKAWTLGRRNDWKSPDEPFFTNCSTFNMAASFILQTCYLFVIYLLLFMTFIFCVLAIQALTTDNPHHLLILKVFCKILFSMAVNSIVGTMSFIKDANGRQLGNEPINNPFINSRDAELRKPYSHLRRREVFLNSNLTPYFQVAHGDEARDCPICLQEFEKESQVVVLPCSQAHVYHVRCLDQHLIAKKDEEAQCVFCRLEI